MTDGNMLRLEFQDDWDVGELAGFLQGLRYVYSSVLNFEETTEDVDGPTFRGRRRMFDFPGPVLFVSEQAPFEARPFDLEAHRARALAHLDLVGDLSVYSIHIASPGWLELIGKLNPLSFIGDMIKFFNTAKHVRQAAAIKNVKTSLEAEILRNKMISGRVKLLSQAGFSKREIQEILRNELATPVRGLFPVIEAKVVRAEMKPIPKPDPGRRKRLPPPPPAPKTVGPPEPEEDDEDDIGSGDIEPDS